MGQQLLSIKLKDPTKLQVIAIGNFAFNKEINNF